MTVDVGTLIALPAHASGATAAPEATVSAPASDLLLLLWRRVPPTAPAITTEGDAALVARFAALADLD